MSQADTFSCHTGTHGAKLGFMQTTVEIGLIEEEIKNRGKDSVRFKARALYFANEIYQEAVDSLLPQDSRSNAHLTAIKRHFNS